MTKTCVYQLPLPPSSNHLWRSVVRKGRVLVVKSDAYKAWLEEVALLLPRPKHPAEGFCSVEIMLNGNVYRARDLDNFLKPTIDAVKARGILLDDNLNHVRQITAEFRPSSAAPSLCVAVGPYVE